MRSGRCSRSRTGLDSAPVRHHVPR
jgi:hypothetical protein